MAIGAIGGITALGGIGAASGIDALMGVGGGAGLGTAGVDAGTGVGAGAGIGTTAGDPTGQAGSSFVDSLGQALGSLNTQLTTADAAMADFASGGSSDLQTVMLQMQEASIGLKVGTAVRDKLLEAYQDVMRMQI